MIITEDGIPIEGSRMYPRLMIAESGVVVLMIEAGKGTALIPGNGKDDHTIGEYSGAWNMSAFVPYTKTITLANVASALQFIIRHL